MPSKAEITAFNKRLRTARVAAGYSRKELAAEVDVIVRTITYWETCRSPNEANVERLAKALNVSFHWLRYGDRNAILGSSDELVCIMQEIEVAKEALNKALAKLAVFNTQQRTSK